MRVTIRGNNPARVIVDHDTIGDTTLEPDTEVDFESNDDGVIELRELGGTQEDPGGEEEEEHH